METRPRFEELYMAHGGAVRAFVRRRLDADLADEVVADVFVTVWRRLDEVPPEPRPWLLGIARGAIANARRGEHRRAALHTRLKSRAVGEGPEGPEGRALRSGELGRAFATLREADRELLRLIAWDGLDRTEAARVLGITPSVFSLRLHRARRRLERALADGGDDERRPDGSASLEVTG